jgi:phosphoglycerate dehydrogenase-like enzyme
MLILALLRRVFESTLLMKASHWPVGTMAANGLFDLQGKTLGILGFGAIGREVARRARAFDAVIRYYDQRPVPAAESVHASFVALDELIESADVITCHVPYTAATHHLIGRTELHRMRRTAILINTARGGVIDESALAEALDQGVIAGAGLDVFAEEPLPAGHPLRRCRNVLLTPHTAGQTREAMARMVAVLLDNIARVQRNEEPRYRVV